MALRRPEPDIELTLSPGSPSIPGRSGNWGNGVQSLPHPFSLMATTHDHGARHLGQGIQGGRIPRGPDEQSLRGMVAPGRGR